MYFIEENHSRVLFSKLFQFITFAAVIAVTRAGVLQGPVSYSTSAIAGSTLAQATPFAAAPYAAAQLAYPTPAITRLAAPLAYSAAAPVLAAPYAKAVVAAPVAKAIVADEYDPNPQYQYGYDVQDALTGDSKNQVESRSGDVVQGTV